MANVSNNVTSLGLPERSVVGTILSFLCRKAVLGSLLMMVVEHSFCALHAHILKMGRIRH